MRAAAKPPRSELRLVVDINAEAARSLAERHGARAESDWRATLQDESVGIVVAATPNAFLREIAVAALDSGKHVLVEKPMGKNAEEARAIADAAQRSGKR